MQIVVLVKQVPDTWSERRLTADGYVDRASSPAIIDEICEYALESALRLRDASGGDVVAVTMGPEAAADVLRRAFQMGVDRGLHLRDDGLRHADLGVTARALAQVVRGLEPDLVITGSMSSDGRAGLIPAMIAEHLAMPLIAGAETLELIDSTVRADRAVEGGRSGVHTSLPAVVTVTERSPAPRVPGMRDALRARKRKPETVTLSDVGGDVPVPSSSVLHMQEKPARAAGPREPFGPAAVRAVTDLLAERHAI